MLITLALRRFIWAGALSAILASLAAPTDILGQTGEEQQFRLHPSRGAQVSTGDTVSLVVRTGDVRLVLTRTAEAPDTIGILLTPFADSLGNVSSWTPPPPG